VERSRLAYVIAALGLALATVAGCSARPSPAAPTPAVAEGQPSAAAAPTAAPLPTAAVTPGPSPTPLIIRYRREGSETPSPVGTKRARTKDINKMQVKAILPLKYVQFYADSAILTEKAKADIKEQVAPLMLAEEGTFMRIEGRAAKPPDETDEACLKLSIDRANAVADYLVSLGVPRERLFPRGVGAQKARFRDSTVEEELAQDRIIEFAIVVPMG